MSDERTTGMTIVGGGISGLALGAAMTQRHLPYHLVEARSGHDQEAGAALAMAPNAMWVLRRLGVADTVIKAASVIRHYRFWNARGQELKVIAMDRLSRRWGEEAWCVPRAHLVATLRSHVPNTRLTMDQPITAITWQDPEFRLTGETQEALTSSAIVGADGAWSIVRRTLWPHSPEPQYQGFYAARGIVRATMPTNFGDSVIQVWGASGELGYAPMGPDHLYWFATMRWPDPTMPPPPVAWRRHFGRWRHPGPNVLADTPDDAWLIHPIFDRLVADDPAPLPATLIGDAAHLMTPNTGQGACQALLDAWTLAECLEREKSPAIAFRRYRELRLHKALAVARISHQLGRAIHQGGLWPSLRDQAIRAVPSRWILAAMARVVGRPS